MTYSCSPVASVTSARPMRTRTPLSIGSVVQFSSAPSRVTERTSKPTTTRLPSGRA
jgi:hypothetical protein